MKGVLFSVLVGMLVALTTSTQEQPHSKNSVAEQFHPTSKDLTGRKAKLIALRSSTTRTVIQSSTTFALSTCIEEINAVACNGKRKRKRSLAYRKTNLNTE